MSTSSYFFLREEEAAGLQLAGVDIVVIAGRIGQCAVPVSFAGGGHGRNGLRAGVEAPRDGPLR